MTLSLFFSRKRSLEFPIRRSLPSCETHRILVKAFQVKSIRNVDHREYCVACSLHTVAGNLQSTMH